MLSIEENKCKHFR